MTQINPGDLLTIKESADLLKLHPNTIRNFLLRGKLKGVRLGSRIVRIPKSELEALLTEFKGGEFGVWNR